MIGSAAGRAAAALAAAGCAAAAALMFALAIAPVPARAQDAAAPDTSAEIATPAPVAGLDLVGAPRRVRRFVRQLASEDAAEWREAQLRLALAGPAMLGALDASHLAREEPGRARVRTLLSLGMLTTLSSADVGRYPALYAVISVDVARGFVIAESLAASPVFDVGQPTTAQLMSHDAAPTEVQRRIASANSLGGFAVPAALDLLRDRHAVARAYGVLLLADLAAVVANDSLAPLESDLAPLVVGYSDTTRDATVASTATRTLPRMRELEQVPRGFELPVTLALKLNGSRDGSPDLLGGIRRTSSAASATTWDEWWTAARPAWRMWWSLAGEEPAPHDRKAWLDYQQGAGGPAVGRSEPAGPR